MLNLHHNGKCVACGYHYEKLNYHGYCVWCQQQKYKQDLEQKQKEQE